MIKAIFFDWGYTFVSSFKDREKKINKVLKPFGLDWQKFHLIWRQFYILRSAGRIKTDKDFENYIKRVSQKEIPVKKIIEIMIESQVVLKDDVELVKNLKKKYKVGILSNYVEGWLRKVLKNYGIENLFDILIISSTIGERKPNALIYYEALKRLSVRPEETVFIADEISEDLVAASGLGIKTIWLNANHKSPWNKNDKKTSKIYKPDAIIKNLKEVISVIKTL
jgi:HAD superfamily hydrolase (TIGR01509 family)